MSEASSAEEANDVADERTCPPDVNELSVSVRGGSSSVASVGFVDAADRGWESSPTPPLSARENWGRTSSCVRMSGGGTRGGAGPAASERASGSRLTYGRRDDPAVRFVPAASANIVEPVSREMQTEWCVSQPVMEWGWGG